MAGLFANGESPIEGDWADCCSDEICGGVFRRAGAAGQRAGAAGQTGDEAGGGFAVDDWRVCVEGRGGRPRGDRELAAGADGEGAAQGFAEFGSGRRVFASGRASGQMRGRYLSAGRAGCAIEGNALRRSPVFDRERGVNWPSSGSSFDQCQASAPRRRDVILKGVPRLEESVFGARLIFHT